MSYRRAAIGTGLAMVLGSCRVDAAEWPAKAAKEECGYAKRCDRANYFYQYVNDDTCRASKESEWAEADLEGCTFDPKEAKQCLDAFQSSCRKVGRKYDALVAPCFRVWTCPVVDDTSGTVEPL